MLEILHITTTATLRSCLRPVVSAGNMHGEISRWKHNYIQTQVAASLDTRCLARGTCMLTPRRCSRTSARITLLWCTAHWPNPAAAHARAAFSFSVYTPLLILFPFAGPMWKEIALWFPDEGLTRVKNGRRVVIDIVSRLMAERRAEMAAEQARAYIGRTCTCAW